MNFKKITPLALGLAAACLYSHADVVVTNDGAQLTGQITRIEAGVIHLTTTYAGNLEIQQAQVTSFETETPINVTDLPARSGSVLDSSMAFQQRQTR